jgi:hypothetical protein
MGIRGEEETLLGNSGLRKEDNIKTGLEYKVCYDDRIELAHNVVQC